MIANWIIEGPPYIKATEISPEFAACLAAGVEFITETKEKNGRTIMTWTTKDKVGFVRDKKGNITQVRILKT